VCVCVCVCVQNLFRYFSEDFKYNLKKTINFDVVNCMDEP